MTLGGELVLASRSPQRRAILETLGVPFRVRVAGIDEGTEGDPIAVAIENARRKALAVAADEPAGTIVLGSDTVIAAEVASAEPEPGEADAERPSADPSVAPAPTLEAVGKPADADEAAAMLRRWSGTAHRVASSVAVVRAGGEMRHELLLADADTTLVRFRTLSDEEIAWYVATGEWQERAGAYAIQLRGTLLVDGIEGDWWTVVGLPVGLIARRLPALLR
jgi:septum formation protein